MLKRHSIKKMPWGKWRNKNRTERNHFLIVELTSLMIWTNFTHKKEVIVVRSPGLHNLSSYLSQVQYSGYLGFPLVRSPTTYHLNDYLSSSPPLISNNKKRDFNAAFSLKNKEITKKVTKSFNLRLPESSRG